MREDADQPGTPGATAPEDAADPQQLAAAHAALEAFDTRLDAVVGNPALDATERARRFAVLELELLEHLPALKRLDPDFEDGEGHAALATAHQWREQIERQALPTEAQAAAALVDDLMTDEIAAWKWRAGEAVASEDPERCFELLREATVLEREGLSRRSNPEDFKRLHDGREPLRQALVEAIRTVEPGRTVRDRWTTALLDQGDVVLTAIDEIAPARGALHLGLAAEDLDWHRDHVESKGGSRRRRLGRKLFRVRSEMQERDLQGRMEDRFGKNAVSWLETIVIWLIFVVLAILFVELVWGTDAEGHSVLSAKTLFWLMIADTAACVVFLTEFFVKLALVRGKTRWFLRHFLIDLVPSIPYGLLLLGAAPGADRLRAGRALRLVRVVRLTRLGRAFGIMARGFDRLARRYGYLLNYDIVLYPNRAERSASRRERYGPAEKARTLRSNVNEQWDELLRAAPASQRAAVAAARTETLSNAREKGLTRRASRRLGRDLQIRQISAEDFERTLATVTPQDLEANYGQEFVARMARAVRIFARPPLRWFPIIRKYVPRIAPSMTEAEVTAAASHKVGAEFKRHHDRWRWLGDLYGTVTPSEFVDRVGTAMVKGSFRPAYRLALFGGFYLLAEWLLGFGRTPMLVEIHAFLNRFVGTTLIVLGAICIAILGLGFWFKYIAGEATFFLQRTARAQFLALTETIKTRHLERDTALLDRRVFRHEAAVEGWEDTFGSAVRQLAFIQSVQTWMVGVKARDSSREAIARVALLYRDSLDGAVFGGSDTRTTSQLLGNPALRQLRALSERISKKERKALRALDLEHHRTAIRGPYLWFSYISKAVTQAAARLIVDYNRNAVPLAELPYVKAGERERYDRWVGAGQGVPGTVMPGAAGRAAANRESEGYVTTAFTALHFLDDEPARDHEVEERFGKDVLENLRADRRLLFRRIFGAYPWHLRPQEQRTVNLYRVYENWFAGGRAFFIPLRVMWGGVKTAGRALAWLGRSVREIRRPKVRHDVQVADEADFATAVRKIGRMRGPLVWACVWMRARFDAEYLGVRIPGIEDDDYGAVRAAEEPAVEEDMRFLGSEVEQERRIADERERAEWDLRRVATLLDGGLMDRVARVLGAKPGELGREHLRAMAAAYRADFGGVRTLLSCAEILNETRIEAAERPARPWRWWPQWPLYAKFGRWWQAHGEGDRVVRKATWRAISHNQNESADALRTWAVVGPEEARRRGEAVSADLLRHVGRISEQIVTLRAVQTLSLIDLLNYREHVYRLGEYATSGDQPEGWLTLAGE